APRDSTVREDTLRLRHPRSISEPDQTGAACDNACPADPSLAVREAPPIPAGIPKLSARRRALLSHNNNIRPPGIFRRDPRYSMLAGNNPALSGHRPAAAGWSIKDRLPPWRACFLS